MSLSRLGRHLLLGFWLHALLVALACVVMVAGLHVLLTRPGHESSLAELWSTGQTLLSRFPAVVAFFAAAMTVGRLRASGALVALPAAGRPLRHVGSWLLLGAVPIAVSAQLVDLFPPFAQAGLETVEPGAGRRTGRLRNGGLYFLADADQEGARRAAALDVVGRRLLLGTLPGDGRGTPAGELRLDVGEVWDLRRDPDATALPDPGVVTCTMVRTPRSLVFGADAAPLDVRTLDRWLAFEPWRADLRFARDAKLVAGLRVLVLVLLGFGFVLRPSPTRIPASAVRAILVGGTYFLFEVTCGWLGVVGSIPSTLAALLPTLAYGALGIHLWTACDRSREGG